MLCLHKYSSTFSCIELPVLRKCLFFLPLRHGLSVLGYVILVLDCVMFLLYVGLMYVGSFFDLSKEEKTAPSDFILLFFMIIDIVMHSILIVGCNQKSLHLLRPYYLYSVLSLFVFAIRGVHEGYDMMEHYIQCNEDHEEHFSVVSEILKFLSFIAFKMYMVLVVRSVIIKIIKEFHNEMENGMDETPCVQSKTEEFNNEKCGC